MSISECELLFSYFLFILIFKDSPCNDLELNHKATVTNYQQRNLKVTNQSVVWAKPTPGVGVFLLTTGRSATKLCNP